jgi:hypothetical protein
MISSNRYGHIKQGIREDIGPEYFRSAWEANYARYLNFLLANKIIYAWEFESQTFWFQEIKRGVRSYLPDFKVWEKKDSCPYFVEVKGWMDKKSATKLKRMGIYHPTIKIILVDKIEYRKICDSFSKIIKNWE